MMAQRFQGVLDQAFRFGARDQSTRIGEQIDIVEFAMSHHIGQRLIVDQPIEIALSARQLIGRERPIGLGQQLRAIYLERMSQYHFSRQARRIDIGLGEAVNGGLAKLEEGRG